MASGKIISVLAFAALCAVAFVFSNTNHRTTELSEQFWTKAQGYNDLDNSVKDYVGAQFHHDVESNVAKIIQQWHQAGGTTMEDHNDYNGDGNSENNNDGDGNSNNNNPFSDTNENHGNHESAWKSFRTNNDHDNGLRGEAKSALQREVQDAIHSAMKSTKEDESNRDHFGSEPSQWLRKSSDAFEDKAKNLRDSTRNMKRELEKDKWISRKWNAHYSHDKVLDHNMRYLRHHARIKSVKHEARMKIPTFKLPKKHKGAKKEKHFPSETHDRDVAKIFNLPEKKRDSGPHIPEKDRRKLANEISKQTGWLQEADKALKGKVKQVKGELFHLKGEVKNLASAITEHKQEKREDILRDVDRNLRQIAESVVHMRAAEKARQMSRREFNSAAETAKERLIIAKKTVEGVLHRAIRS